jgi:hypothetical protein
MKRVLTIGVLAALLSCTSALAQVGGMGSPTPGVGVTSPLGITPSSSTSPVGIPLGATEIGSSGLSPAPVTTSGGTIGMTGGVTTCGTVGGASSETPAASSTYDGGGMATGSGSSLASVPSMSGTPMSGMCGTAASSSTPPTTATLTPSPGGASRAGIPLGSVEIGSAGVSPLVVVPAPSPYSSTMGSGTPCSMTGSTMSSSMSSTGC